MLRSLNFSLAILAGLLWTIASASADFSLPPDLPVTPPAETASQVNQVFFPFLFQTHPSYTQTVQIPAGSFWMGCDRNNPAEACHADQRPLHSVYLPAFEIDKFEVTNARYAACVATSACPPPEYRFSRTRPSYYGNPQFDFHPVIYVMYEGAQAFCRWEGSRLPTEAEWEKAARGSLDTRAYPWGNDPPDCSRLNAQFCTGDTTRVGSYPSGASPYGVMDMAGNVWEWVSDWYDKSYYGYSQTSSPAGPAVGTHKVLRGGSWFHDYARLAFRFSFEPGRWTSFGLGFRCVRP